MADRCLSFRPPIRRPNYSQSPRKKSIGPIRLRSIQIAIRCVAKSGSVNAWKIRLKPDWNFPLRGARQGCRGDSVASHSRDRGPISLAAAQERSVSDIVMPHSLRIGSPIAALARVAHGRCGRDFFHRSLAAYCLVANRAVMIFVGLRPPIIGPLEGTQHDGPIFCRHDQ